MSNTESATATATPPIASEDAQDPPEASVPPATQDPEDILGISPTARSAAEDIALVANHIARADVLRHFQQEEQRPYYSEEPQDIFGFHSGSSSFVRLDSEATNVREATLLSSRWIDFVKNWNVFLLSRAFQFKHMVREGVPSRLRGFVWRHISGGERMLNEHRGFYEWLLNRSSSHYEQRILNDIARTFPQNSFFLDRNYLGQRVLFRVLKAYSVYRPEVGYCQGMGFLVGVLLMHMSEHECFWTLVQLLHGYREGNDAVAYRLVDLYKKPMRMVHEWVFIFKKLIHKFLPTVLAHYEQLDVPVDLFATQWFMTMFIYSFSFELVLRVFDAFFNEGPKVVFRVALAVLKINKQEILQQTKFENLVRFSQRELPEREKDIDRLMSVAFGLSLSQSHIDRFSQEFDRQSDPAANGDIEALRRRVREKQEKYRVGHFENPLFSRKEEEGV